MPTSAPMFVATPQVVTLTLHGCAPDLDWTRLAAALPASAQQRLARMSAPARRREFVVGRLLVAHLLRVEIGGAGWELVPQAGGKPIAIDSAGQQHSALSISHSRGQVLCAIAPTGELGCDIEVPRARGEPSWRRLARADLPHPVFGLHERRWILAATFAARERRLYALWTVKEAIGKASGLGLRGRLAEVSVDLAALETALADAGAFAVSAQPSAEAATQTDQSPTRQALSSASCVVEQNDGQRWYVQLMCTHTALVAVANSAPFVICWRTAESELRA